MGVLTRRCLLLASFCYLVSSVRSAAIAQTDNENSVDPQLVSKTLKEVEEMLSKNPDLPRLTRGEILSLIEEVQSQSLKPVGHGVRDDKALVVVLPYTGNGTDMAELYTAAPVTEVIKEAGDVITTTTTKRPKRRRKPSSPRPVYLPSSTEPSTSEASSTNTPFIPTNTTPSKPIPVIYKTTKKKHTTTTPVPESEWVPFKPDVGVPDSVQHALPHVRPATQSPTIFVTAPKAKPPRTTTPKPDVETAAESLSPDMKALLAEFGLLGDTGNPEPVPEQVPEEPEIELRPIAPSVDPSSYVRFKPLPASLPADQGMQSFLASFGLLDTTSRNGKSVKQSQPMKVKDLVPEHLGHIVDDLGLDAALPSFSRQDKRLHVFNPADSPTTKQNVDKIQKILRKLKEIEQGKHGDLTQEQVKDILIQEVGDIPEFDIVDENDSRLTNATFAQIDPLESDGFTEEITKNEFKRQQDGSASASASASSSSSSSGGSVSSSSSSSSSSSVSSDGAVSSSASSSSSASGDEAKASAAAASSSSSDSSSSSASASASASAGSASPSEPTTTTTTDAGPSLTDLEDSFGGDITTTKRPNGLYFLLDWNTFLNVGLDERKVDIKFAPKIGDPSLFLPVTVP